MQGIGPQPQWMHKPVSPSWSGSWGNGNWNSAVQHRNVQNYSVQRRMTHQEARAKRDAQNVQKRRDAEVVTQQRLQREPFERAEKEHQTKMATDPMHASKHREKQRKQAEMQSQNRKAAAAALGLLGAAFFSGGDDASVSSGITHQDRDDLRQYNMNRHRAIQENARAGSVWSR